MGLAGQTSFVATQLMDMNTCMYILTLVGLSSLVSITDGVTVVELVTRRLTGDTYTITQNNSNLILCSYSLTFLVNERRCVRNEELFNGS